MIEVLGSHAFLGALRDVAAPGESVMFRGKLEVEGENIRCYIKPFPSMLVGESNEVGENRSVISEALGYVLGKACGFTVARKAGVIFLRSEQIPGAALRKLVDQTPGKMVQDEYLAWFSEDMRHSSLMSECPSDAPELMRQRNIARIAADLAAHESSPRIVSFDEWTENSDRHLGNILSAPNGGLTLIDHGRLFRHPSWSPGKLGKNPRVARNALMELIDSHDPDWSSRTPIRSARSLAYKSFSVAWKSEARTQAELILREFMEPPEVSLVLEFLTERLDPSQYTPRVGLML
ncbi:hypothetical protein B8W72_20770 [Pseudomonas putida]|uniref:HipA-like C-terminal domain-containing protein n=1 Tax=Pseudomonas putida TaxID=303 RepID=A0A1Y3KT62_PSEPU|nr:hypothetical protein [Pseudomonas putida]OUM28294.1 hypothetical protein B8W72_20770 [Pseudomonas putida]